MKEPSWIGVEECLAFHNQLLSRFGGIDGVRDRGLLESALNRPLHLYHYGNPTLFDLAAAYAQGVVKNHPFLDGNKRTGFLCAAWFLESNDYRFIAPEPEAVLQTVGLAAGEIGAEAYAAWLERNCEARGGAGS